MNDQNPLELEIARLRAENERLSREVASLRSQRREFCEVIMKNAPPPEYDEAELLRERDSWIPIPSVSEKVDQWMREAGIDP